MKKTILVAITGGIAAYKAADVISGLKASGHKVNVITTDNALNFITPTVIGAISDGNYYTDKDPNKIMHIELAQSCDLFLCVPATANTIAKFANGIADNIVTSTFLALPQTTKKVICPAMNTKMYENYITQRNITQLKTGRMNEKYDCKIIEPVQGLLACGAVGIGKLDKPRNIVGIVNELLNDEPIWHFPLDLKLLGTTNDSNSYFRININKDVEIPITPHVGSFGVRRKFDRHRGVDLYAPEKSLVFAVEDGEVKMKRPWTGTRADCDWWEDTDALLVEGRSGLVVYGEIEIAPNLKEGDKVKRGEVIGFVKRVLKKDKGRPMSMLHIELRKPGFYKNIDKSWEDDNMPNGVLDPTNQLIRCMNNTLV
jgi:phosphopantothenoylcysteine decarboxylase